MTSADPDARTALSRVVRLVAPPVPSKSREDSSSPAMTNWSGTELTTGATELMSVTVISATLKGGDDLAVHRQRHPWRGSEKTATSWSRVLPSAICWGEPLGVMVT